MILFTVKIGHKNTIQTYFFSVSIKFSLCILIQLFFLSTQGLFNRFWLKMKMSLFTSSWGPCSSLKASWCHKGPPLLDWLKEPLFLKACRRQFNHSSQHSLLIEILSLWVKTAKFSFGIIMLANPFVDILLMLYMFRPQYKIWFLSEWYAKF